MSTTEKQSFYITTTLPYVNARPHIGHAIEFIKADAIARYFRLKGVDVFFNTGTDEHGQKIAEKAGESKMQIQAYTDMMSQYFLEQADILDISYDRFIRTTDEDHVAAAQVFWNMCKERGFIYKKTYKGLYCVGDEMFLKEKDLVEGKCPNHPNQDVIEIEEENYFFAFSKFEQQLKEKILNSEFITPSYRAKEMLQMVEDGLEDFSISRLKEKVSWGVPVPGDDEQVMYVWFDALVNYISALGWPSNTEKFNKFWTNGNAVQICGKDNTQHQALRWQAMLMAAELPTTDTIIVNGFVVAPGGQKMSKSLGNVIDPQDVIDAFGVDGMRYFALREVHPHEDTAVSMDKIAEAYNANLANGIGNLTNRILKMAEDNLDAIPDFPSLSVSDSQFLEYEEAFESYNIQKAADFVWQKVGNLDQIIQDSQPFKLVKENPEQAKDIIEKLVIELYTIAFLLQPLLPKTAKKMKISIEEMKKPESPLFQRI